MAFHRLLSIENNFDIEMANAYDEGTKQRPVKKELIRSVECFVLHIDHVH